MDLSNKDLLPMYVSNPEQNKETLTSYTSYTLQGVRVPEPLQRRYRDFASFREKLVERWPGVFIPNIPHKQMVGSNDKEVISMRIEMINRFCQKLSLIGSLFNSEEMDLFLQNTNDVPKTLATLKPQTYEEILRKYSASFLDYDENFDTQAGKEKQNKFLEALKALLPKVRTFRDIVKNCRDKFQPLQKNVALTLNLLELYERESLTEYTNKDESKLILCNMQNPKMQSDVLQVKENLLNPYEKLYELINGDMLDIEAMIEALQSLKGLQDTYDKITSNYNATSNQLSEIQAGKSNFKSIFSFKSKEQDISSLTQEKEKLQKDLNNLEQIIKMATHHMDIEMRLFKTANLDGYYEELWRIKKRTNENGTLFGNFCDDILENPAIKGIKI